MLVEDTDACRNACPGAEILGRLCYARSYGYRRVAMPAQGQKSWDTVASKAQRARVSDIAMTAQGRKILGHAAVDLGIDRPAHRNACPGAENPGTRTEC